MSNTLAFKCYLTTNGGQDKEIRRFTIESDVVGNFTYVKEKVRSIYPQLLRENFSLMYIDEESDKITISSDDELVAALMYVKRKENEPFRLMIQTNGGPKSTPSAAPSDSNGNCQGDIHFGVTCDGCQGEVRGFRYKCVQCPDYDLCGKCEAAGQHAGHTFIRVTGAVPACFPVIRNLLVAGGNNEMPHWRRMHHRGRQGHFNPHHGRWNAWCPSDINVEVDPPKSEDCKAPPNKHCADAGKSSCPFKANMEQAREQAKIAAETLQTNGPEILEGIGSTIATILAQFGINTQVDVHGPETDGKCPREAAKNQQPEAAKAEEKAKEEVIIPIVVEKEEELKKEVIIPITIVKDDEGATSPYAEVAAEVAAAKQSRTNSPTRENDGWTMVGDVDKQSVATELGARPKSPQKQVEEAAAPLHPDPLVAEALEKMLAMGFTNEGGWLAQLLEVKGGDIGKALDVLQSRFQRSPQ